MNNKKGTILVALAAISWSGAGVLGKYTSWSGLPTAGMRALVAVLIMAIVRGGFKVKLSRGNLLGAFGCAATSILFIVANKLTTAANAIVLQYAMPAVVILLNWAGYHQRPARRDIMTCLLVLTGVILCSVGNMAHGNILGDIIALVTAFTYALVFFCSHMPDASVNDYTFLGLLLCVPCLLFIPGDPGSTFTLSNILALIGMGICLAGGYILISLGMRFVSPMSAAITSNIEPVLSPIWVFIFIGEAPGWLAIVGAVIVLGTVTWYSLPQRKKVS